MRLILLSNKNEIIRKYLPSGKKVGFVPTASELDNDRWYMEKDRKKLIELGYNVIDIEVTYETTEKIKEKINNSDALFIAGGNSFYLLQQLKSKNIVEVINDFVNSNKLYMGASAGAVIACPTIEVVKELDEPKEAPFLESYTALNLVDFYILPHYNNEKFNLKADLIEKKYSNFDFIKLTDNQAIIVSDRNSFEVVETE
jgi:dipeptidase E